MPAESNTAREDRQDLEREFRQEVREAIREMRSDTKIIKEDMSKVMIALVQVKRIDAHDMKFDDHEKRVRLLEDTTLKWKWQATGVFMTAVVLFEILKIWITHGK